jgi:ornithine cyclodeaminase
MRLLTASDIRRVVSMVDAIGAVKQAFRELSLGQAAVPVRTSIVTEAGQGTALYMPAYLAASHRLGVKAVAVYPRNRECGLPTIFAAVLLQDTATGRPTALLEGTALTALRTGAATGAATDLLARPDATRLCLFGTGAQAPAQVEAVCAVRPIEVVWICSRQLDRARSFAAQLSTLPFAARLAFHVTTDPHVAVPQGDIIVTATPARSPLFDDADVRDGTHVNAIGAFTPQMQEIPAELVARAKLVVDSREACMAEAGDILIPIRDGRISAGHIYAELGELVAGQKPGRTSASEVTLFKSVGNAVQDLAVGYLALERAERQGLGQVVDLGGG